MENAQAERLATTTTSAQETAAAPPAPSKQAGLALEGLPLRLTPALTFEATARKCNQSLASVTMETPVLEMDAAVHAILKQAGPAAEVQPLLLTHAQRSVAMEEDLTLYRHTVMTETMFLETDAAVHE